ncbi:MULTISPECIES: RNA polymerase sigma factor [Hyphococcus]|uniref:RNA polymerase sigma factor n=2 Tax=Parvularculaceae TaxID=255474 RepID=UPI0035C73019
MRFMGKSRPVRRSLTANTHYFLRIINMSKGKAFVRSVIRYEKELRAYFLRRMSSRADAEDLTQEVILRALCAAERQEIEQLTKPRWRSQSLCNHEIASDGRLIWRELPVCGSQISRNDGLRRWRSVPQR